MRKKQNAQILIEMANHYENTGSAMMVINIIQYLDKLNPGMVYYLGGTDTIMIKFYKKNIVSNCKIYSYPLKFQKIPFTRKTKINKILNVPISIVNKLFRFTWSFKNIKFDKVIFLGGDNFSPVERDDYKGDWYVRNLNWVNSRSQNTETILFGQTIAPYPKDFEIKASQVLQNVKVYSRDNNTYQYLKEELNLKNVFNGYDLAFLDLPFQNKKEEVAKKYNLPKDYVVFVPSGFWSVYSPEKEKYYTYLQGVYDVLKNYCTTNSCKLVLLAHVLGPGEHTDDRISIENIRFSNNDIIIIDKREVHESRLIIGGAKFTVTGRMHAAVSSFQMGKPAISLGYSKKYKSVLGDIFDIDGKLNIDGIKSVQSQDVTELAESILYVDNNYSKLLQSIRQTVNNMKKKIMLDIEQMIN